MTGVVAFPPGITNMSQKERRRHLLLLLVFVCVGIGQHGSTFCCVGMVYNHLRTQEQLVHDVEDLESRVSEIERILGLSRVPAEKLTSNTIREEEEGVEEVPEESTSPGEGVLTHDSVRVSSSAAGIIQSSVTSLIENLSSTHREAFAELSEYYSCPCQGGTSDDEGLSAEDRDVLSFAALGGCRDALLLAFLRPLKFNVEEAKASMRRAAAWRREYGTNTLFDRRLPAEKARKHRECWPTGMHGVDREGYPVFYDLVGSAEVSQMLQEPNALNFDELIQMYTQNMEMRRRYLLPELSKQWNRGVLQFVVVLDLKHMGIRHLKSNVISYTRTVSHIFHDNYSDMVKKLYIINAPWIFNKAYKAVESFLSKETREKIHVLSSLEEVVDIDQIPFALGGTSPAVVGPSDPQWKILDKAMAYLAGETDRLPDYVMDVAAPETDEVYSESAEVSQENESNEDGEEAVCVESDEYDSTHRQDRQDEGDNKGVAVLESFDVEGEEEEEEQSREAEDLDVFRDSNEQEEVNNIPHKRGRRKRVNDSTETEETTSRRLKRRRKRGKRRHRQATGQLFSVDRVMKGLKDLQKKSLKDVIMSMVIDPLLGLGRWIFAFVQNLISRKVLFNDEI